MLERCGWAGSELGMPYHDQEWGVPVHDDRLWFEFITLEGAQAGLSWETILRKRDSYRLPPSTTSSRPWSPHIDDAKVQALLADPGIIRNRLKVASAITNAKAFLEVQRELGSFDAFIWGFVGGSPQVNARQSMDEVPATTPESDALSKELRRRSFKFVGSTICYALMQATGLVNDHTTNCFRYDQVG